MTQTPPFVGLANSFLLTDPNNLQLTTADGTFGILVTAGTAPPTVAQPSVTSLSPTSGVNGDAVTITGTNFDGATLVRFGGNAASFTVSSSTSIAVTAPTGTGTVDVTVTTAGGTSATGAGDLFTYTSSSGPPGSAPTVTAVSPATGTTSGGTSVTITGTSFTGATAVRFGGVSASFTVGSSTSITATVPPGSGTVDVTVTNPSGTSATSGADQYVYVAPTGGGGSTFMSAPRSPGVVAIDGQSNVQLASMSFSVSDVAVQISNCTGVYLHDLDFDSCVGCIFLFNCTGVRIEDIRARNTGQNSEGSGNSNIIQLNGCTAGGGLTGIRRVRAYGGGTEDMISIFESSGLGIGSELIIENCALESPLPPDALAWQSNSGSGIQLDAAGAGCFDVIVRNNTGLNCGQVGIGIGNATRAQILNNILYGAQRTDNNVGLSTPFSVANYPGGCIYTGNRIFWKNAAGSNNSLFDGGSDITETVGPNTLNDTTINPASLAVVL